MTESAAAAALTTEVEAMIKLSEQEEEVVFNDEEEAKKEEMPDEEKVVEKSPRGRYLRFKELLGKGAYKEVWRSYDSVEGIEVAWNVVNLKNLPAAEKARVINEVRLLDRLEHENIIDFHGSWVNREKGEVVFVTEILSSGSLKRFINKVKVIRWKIVKRWCKQILKALDYLHVQDPPIIHRDIKCDNIFINGATGDLRIGDLGLSTTVTLRPPGTKGQSVLGTPEFMAPELYEEAYDEKVDIYAFGMCLVEMITKQLPYDECANATQIYLKVTSNIAPRAFHLIDDNLAKKFVRCCAAADPRDRLTAAELLLHPFLKPDAEFDETEIKLKQLPSVDEQKQEPLTLPSLSAEERKSIQGQQPFSSDKVSQEHDTTIAAETAMNPPSTKHDASTAKDEVDKRRTSSKDLVYMQPAAALAEAAALDAVSASSRYADAAVDAAALALCEARRNGYEDDQDVRADYNEAIKDNSTRRFKKIQEATPTKKSDIKESASSSPQSEGRRSPTPSRQQEEDASNEAPISAVSTAYFSANGDDSNLASPSPDSGQSADSTTPPVRKQSRVRPDASFNGMWLDTQDEDDDDEDDDQDEELIVSAILQDEDEEAMVKIDEPVPIKSIAVSSANTVDIKAGPNDVSKPSNQTQPQMTTNGESRQQPDDDDDDAYLAKMQDSESLLKNDKVRVHEGRRKRSENERLTPKAESVVASRAPNASLGKSSTTIEKRAGSLPVPVSIPSGTGSTPSSCQSSPQAGSRPPLQQVRPSSAVHGRDNNSQQQQQQQAPLRPSEVHQRPSSATTNRESSCQHRIMARRSHDELPPPPPPQQIPPPRGSPSSDRLHSPRRGSHQAAPPPKKVDAPSPPQEHARTIDSGVSDRSPQQSDELETLTTGALDRHGSSMVHSGANGSVTNDDDGASVVSQSIREEVLDDDTVSLSFPYTFDGVGHRVSFDYDLREEPLDVANEFALECGYPIDEIWPLVDFLADLRERYRGGSTVSVQPSTRGPPSRQSSDVGSGYSGMPQNASYESLWNGTAGGESDHSSGVTAAATTSAAPNENNAAGTSPAREDESPIHDVGSVFDEENTPHIDIAANTQDELTADNDEIDDDDDDEEIRSWKERIERDYKLNTSRAQSIHEDRMIQLEHSREETVSSDAEAVAKIDKELQKIEHKERDLNMSRDAVVSDRERLLKKLDKDIQDYKRKFLIEQNNHTRRLQEFQVQYQQQHEEIRRLRRAKQDALNSPLYYAQGEVSDQPPPPPSQQPSQQQRSPQPQHYR